MGARLTVATAATSLSLIGGAAGAVPTHDHPPRTGGDSGAAARCPEARKGLAFYRARFDHWHGRIGARRVAHPVNVWGAPCPRVRRLASSWRDKARAERERWGYHFAWWVWLPDKWQRIGACETGYGRRPGVWTFNSGAYQGAFGFAVSSWDSFAPRADRRAAPYPSEAYLATPRQQYEVALAIADRYGLSGWGCRNA